MLCLPQRPRDLKKPGDGDGDDYHYLNRLSLLRLGKPCPASALTCSVRHAKDSHFLRLCRHTHHQKYLASINRPLPLGLPLVDESGAEGVEVGDALDGRPSRMCDDPCLCLVGRSLVIWRGHWTSADKIGRPCPNQFHVSNPHHSSLLHLYHPPPHCISADAD